MPSAQIPWIFCNAGITTRLNGSCFGENALEIPEWTPPILRTLYENKDMLSRFYDADGCLLLERLIFDARMRTVWNMITKIAEEQGLEGYPFVLFDVICDSLKFPVPKYSKDKIKKSYVDVINKCLAAKEAIKSLPTEFIMKNLSRSLESQAIIATLLIDANENEHYPYESLNITIEKCNNPRLNQLARLFNMAFEKDLGSPLWDYNAILIEVVLNLERGSITKDQVRALVGDYEPEETLRDLPGWEDTAEIEFVPM